MYRIIPLIFTFFLATTTFAENVVLVGGTIVDGTGKLRFKGNVRIKDGKIIEHSDGFKLSRWAAQALGIKGEFLGWTGWMKRKIQKNARKNLMAFMEKKNVNK